MPCDPCNFRGLNLNQQMAEFYKQLCELREKIDCPMYGYSIDSGESIIFPEGAFEISILIPTGSSALLTIPGTFAALSIPAPYYYISGPVPENSLLEAVADFIHVTFRSCNGPATAA